MTEDKILNIVFSVQPIIVNQEPVGGGFRPLKRKYIFSGGTIIENIRYSNQANSDGWGAIEGRDYEVNPVDEIITFREWNISDHPTIPNIYRKLGLANLIITSSMVQILYVVSHYIDSGRTISAPYSNVLIPASADNTNMVDVPLNIQQLGYPTTIGEWDMYELLTTLGQSVYSILDARIPQIDALGRFGNQIY